jgi:uncharacterized membrane protein YqhA
MLKGVIFYIIGVGLYNLVVTPIQLCTQFGVSSLNDLEEKVVSVVIVIFAVQFLKQLTLWEEPLKIMYFGLATTAVTLALVAFLRFVIQNTKSNFPTNPSQENLITEHSDCNSPG